MNRGDAYKVLASLLEELRAEGYVSLLRRIDQSSVSEVRSVNGEDIIVESAVCWEDKTRHTLRVSATVYGPSTWTMERLVESFVVGPNNADAT